MGTKDKNLNIRISAVQKKKIEDDEAADGNCYATAFGCLCSR